MTVEKILAEVSRELSGALAKQNAACIAAHHRIQGSPGFDAALGWVREALEQLSIACTTHSYPADGKHKTFSWTAPLAWRARSGSLRQLAPKEQVLIRFFASRRGL